MANSEREKLLEVLKRFDDLYKKYPNSDIVHLFRYAIGAIYALHRSINLGHKNRKEYNDSDKSQLLKDIDDVSMAIKENSEPPKIWEAGFFYYASVARVDAINERFLEAIKEEIDAKPNKRRGETYIDCLVKCIQEKRSIKIDPEPFNIVRYVINDMKHEICGQTVKEARKLKKGDHEIILDSLKELLKLLEQKEVEKLLVDKYGVV